ncbi:YciI family protein [Streptomyces shenzhenensis]|uniref:YCII-related domain-containing protein n=1 Tax=Streptomyces shenzhenensis TaxID=943815 RepID=A0A3M0HZI8_9ACTN|nr:YciI family protein [Streptomyces shenzhenensis]RMB79863.1 hypothetical protein CTZ28_43060 [Streptomyces shenzhenensis]
MEFFRHHRDRSGSTAFRTELVAEHRSRPPMDRYADELIARGPTFAADGGTPTPTGSVHIVDLPDPAAARAFAFGEPNYQAGVHRDVLLRRRRNLLRGAPRHLAAAPCRPGQATRAVGRTPRMRVRPAGEARARARTAHGGTGADRPQGRRPTGRRSTARRPVGDRPVGGQHVGTGPAEPGPSATAPSGTSPAQTGPSETAR